MVIYSQLTPESADRAIEREIAYFDGLGQEFEWKVFLHDHPSDLVDRLAARGFEIDEPEAVLVLDLADSSPIPWHSVRRIQTPAELAEVAAVKERVYSARARDLMNQLAFEMDHAPGYLSVYVACVDAVAAATAWIRFPEAGAFASLWGGATLPEFRRRGLYTSLLGARLEHARRRGYRYATVDAGNMSRPILEKHGFRLLTYATACTWHG
jgi:GNAT superfamily N-acetyltransferase